MTIADRLIAIEKKMPFYSLPGTQLMRVLHPMAGMDWSLGVGGLGQPLTFFVGKTVEEVLEKTEIWAKEVDDAFQQRIREQCAKP